VTTFVVTPFVSWKSLGSPIALAESYLSAVPLVAPPLGRWLLAKVVDFVAAFLVLVPFAWLIWATYAGNPWTLAFLPLIVIVGGSLLFAAGTVLAEYWFGQTFGKWLLGLRVVRASGARVGFGQAVVRVLPVALEGVFPVVAAFVFFTEKQQRAFELLSKTRVVVVTTDHEG
jgi:uncharacterized RDD family membrane protein YckC